MTDTLVQQQVEKLVQQCGTANAAAMVLGVHESMVSLLRSGKREPSVELARKLGLLKEIKYSLLTA